MSFLQLEKVAVGAGGASSVTFSDLPDSAGDLVIYMSIKSDSVDDTLAISTQNTGNYNCEYSRRTNAAGVAVATSLAGSWRIPDGIASTTYHTDNFTNFKITFYDYNGSHRAVGMFQGGESHPSNSTQAVSIPLGVLVTEDSEAITSLTFDLVTGTIQEGSTFTLFHIKP